MISPNAHIGTGCTVHETAIVEEGVSIGAGTVVKEHCIIRRGTVIGERNVIGPFVTLGEPPEHTSKLDACGGVTIGNDNILREHVSVHSGTLPEGTRIGDGCLVMCYSHVSHDATVGDGVTLSFGAQLAGHTTVQDRATLGVHACVHQYSTVGSVAMVGMNSTVVKDVPPFMKVAGTRCIGANVVGIERCLDASAGARAIAWASGSAVDAAPPEVGKFLAARHGHRSMHPFPAATQARPGSAIDARQNPSTVLVTGGCGFIGSHLVNRLLRIRPAIKVVNVDALQYNANKKNVQVPEGADYVFVHGNVMDPELVSRVLSEHGVDVVVHVAAMTHVDQSFGNSVEFTRNNIIGTHVMLEAARQHEGLLKFVHISTDEVYGEVDVPANEATLLQPTNPYAASKTGAEMLVHAYKCSYSLPVCITRCNNVYGPQQYPDKVVPKFIRHMLDGEPCTIHGAGLHMRSYLYIDDAVSALETVVFRGSEGEVYNIGAMDNSELSTTQVASALGECVLGTRDPPVVFVEDRPFNDSWYRVDASKLEKLGWRPTVSVEEGFRKTVAWYRANPTWWHE